MSLESVWSGKANERAKTLLLNSPDVSGDRPERNPAIFEEEIVDFNVSELMSEFLEFFMRHYFIVGAWVVVIGMLIVVQFRLLVARIPKAQANVAVKMVNTENGAFVDVRSRDFYSKGHIVYSINLQLADIKSGKVHLIESYRNKPVILVGRDKMDSDCFNSARFLKKQGFSKIFILDGGLQEWVANNMPLSTKK